MKLFYASSSPFVRKVTVLLHETGQFDQVTLLPVYGSPVDPGDMPLDQNPLGKLPTLLREDGRAIYDSRVITRYLDARAQAGLYPKGEALWDTLVVEATADGILESALQVVYEKRLRAPEDQSEDLIEGYWQKAVRAVQLLSSQWMVKLNGPLDMGRIAVGCALGYLDFRLPDRDWRTGNEELSNWFEDFSRRESMQLTEPKNVS